MHEVILIFLRGRLKVFVNGNQMFLYGELKPVPDDDKNWQRILDNLNVPPKEISLLLMCDETTDGLLTHVRKTFSGIKQSVLSAKKPSAAVFMKFRRVKFGNITSLPLNL